MWFSVVVGGFYLEFSFFFGKGRGEAFRGRCVRVFEWLIVGFFFFLRGRCRISWTVVVTS